MRTIALFIIATALFLISLELSDIADSLRIVHNASGRVLVLDFDGGKHGKVTSAIEK